MKKFWKTLGLTALAAALVPYRIEGDKQTGSLTVQALLWKLTEKTDANGTKDLSITFLPFGADEEDGLFTDDPEEAVLFADHDPEAAAIQHEAAAAEHEAAVAEPEDAGKEADEAGFDPEL